MASSGWTVVSGLETDEPQRVSLAAMTREEAWGLFNELKRAGYDTEMAVLSHRECEFLGVE
jgi:hypothetical protein